MSFLLSRNGFVDLVLDQATVSTAMAFVWLVKLIADPQQAFQTTISFLLSRDCFVDLVSDPATVSV